MSDQLVDLRVVGIKADDIGEARRKAPDRLVWLELRFRYGALRSNRADSRVAAAAACEGGAVRT